MFAARTDSGSPLQSSDEQFGLAAVCCRSRRSATGRSWLSLVDEIINEQDEFDAMLDAREHLSTRKRRLLILLIIIIAALATLGLIDL
jgi:hypothetical protein